MTDSKLKIITEGIVGVASIVLTVLFSPVLRSWYSRWGASEAEAHIALPGDEFVPRPKSQLTCAVTVNAPAEKIWPWLAQIGCQRAGWYSYDLLDNGGAPSADRIIPEYQHLQVGEVVKAMPQGDFGFPVARIEPNQALVLAGTMNTQSGQSAGPNDPDLQAYFSGDQTFVIRDSGQQTARLIFRMRVDWNSTLLNKVVYRGILEPISFVMGRKMLLTLKQRAEQIA